MPLNMADKATVNAKPKEEPVITEPEPAATESKSDILHSVFRDFSPILTEKRGVEGFRSVSFALIPTFKHLYGERFNTDEYLKIAENQLSFLEKRASTGLDLTSELTRMRNAFHYAALQASGIKQVVWRSKPDCPHCQELNGKIVDIGESFTDGQKLRHPPFKSLCDCDIEGVV